MKTQFLGHAAVCALATTVLTVGCNPGAQSRVASSGSKASAARGRVAAEYAALGQGAMRGRNGTLAVTMAERAVAAQPDFAPYRAQLGQSYLLAGRFASAIDAFRDTIALAPDDGRALLGMALAQGALGRQDAARASVTAAAGRIGEADRGLALALAGDGDAAIAILEPAARASDAVPKTRQNLALAYALAGRWDVSRATAAQDVTAADLDARMAKWAQLAKPQAQVDRVAAFLGVTAVAIDEGMPTQLALGTITPPGAAPVALAAAAPIVSPVTLADAVPRVVDAPVAMAVAQAAPEPAPVTTAPAAETTVLLARQERDAPAPTAGDPPTMLLQPDRPIRARLRPQASAVLMRAAYLAPTPRRGPWAVQLGAFASGRSIEDAWIRVSRMVRPVAGMVPLSSTIRTRGRMFQRLAVGGLIDRASAVTLCEQVRAARGVCFVRATANEAPMQMAARARAVRIAAR